MSAASDADVAGESVTVCLLDGTKYAENPYMSLLRNALDTAGLDVRTPDPPPFFPITRTVVRHPGIDVVQIDWLYDRYILDSTGVRPIDAALTMLRAVTFITDLLVAALLPVAVVRTVHNRGHHEGAYARTDRLVSEASFATADAVTVKCDAARRIIGRAYTLPSPDRMDVVPDGSYVRAYENEVTRASARRELDVPDGAFVYLFFGQVRRYKGVLDLVETFADLDHADAELLIVGPSRDEALERELARRAATDERIRTEFRFVPDDRVQYYLNAADVLVLPYRRILNSGSARLGLSFGLPLVAPKMGCLPETVPPDNEFLYDPDTVGGLDAALRAAYDHPDLDRIGSANLEHARRRTWADAAAAYCAVYRRTLGRADASEPAAGADDRP